MFFHRFKKQLVGGIFLAAFFLNIFSTSGLTIVSTDMTSQPDVGGIRVFFTVFVTNANPPFKYEWQFETNDVIQFTNTVINSPFYSNTVSRVFGPFELVPDEFYIGVTGASNDFNGTTGTVLPPCGSICLSVGVPSTITGITGSGTNVAFSSSCGNFPAGSRWFRMTGLTVPGIASISTEGSDYDTTLGVYRGSISNPANLILVNCNNDISVSNHQSRVEFESRPQTNYWLAVNTTNGGNLKLTYSYELKIASITKSNNTVDVRSAPVPSMQYSLLGATNLSTNAASWTVLQTTNFSANTSSSNNIIRYLDTNFLKNALRFYQLKLLP